MKAAKKQWVTPDLQIFGDMQSLTQGNGPPCPTAVQKGHGSGDTFVQQNEPNPNNGCNSSIS